MASGLSHVTLIRKQEIRFYPANIFQQWRTHAAWNVQQKITSGKLKVEFVKRQELQQSSQGSIDTPNETKLDDSGKRTPKVNQVQPEEEEEEEEKNRSSEKKLNEQKNVRRACMKKQHRCYLKMGIIIGIVLLAAAATTIVLSLLPKTTIQSTFTTTPYTTTSAATVTTTSMTTETSTISIFVTTTTTSTISTTTSTFTMTTSTETTTTTMTSDSCGILRWNLTGIRVAGTGVGGDTPDKLRQPRCLYIDVNDTLYICDYSNNRIQKWIIGASNGTTVTGNSNGNVGTDPYELDHPTGIDFDKYQYMYVADYLNHRIQRYPPNSPNGTTVAGTGSPGTATTRVDQPTAVMVDDNLNMYITENGNNRLVFWPFNATNSTILINGRPGEAAYGELSNPYDMILVNGSSNQVYLSDATKNRIQLWTFGAGNGNKTFSSASSLNLDAPRQIMLDPYGNLYAADSSKNRVVVFCSNSTIGYALFGRDTNSTPTLDTPSGIAFDSNFNLYVASSNNHEVLKYQRI